MENLTSCDYCGAAIEVDGIRHRQRLFCSDECCEAFEDELLEHGEPDAAELDAADDPLTYDADLGDDLDGEIDGDLAGDDDFEEDDDF